MYRIGIIGTENTHALTFAKLINLPNEKTGKLLYPDAKVVGVYGPDLESATRIVEEANAEFIAASADNFFGKVDAMIITCRKGSLHAQYAMPFIQKGIPCFIDKPFTVDREEAVKLIEEAKKRNVPLSGGSGCKLAYDVTLLQNEVEQMVKANTMITGSVSFPADPDSEYDGFYFYSPHLVEMALTIFGFDVESVVAFEKNKSRICLFRYKNYDITLNFTKDAKQYTGIIYGQEKNVVRNIDISFIFKQEVEHYIHMLRTGEMPQSYEELVKPVSVINAIEQAIQTGKETKVQ
ncbi:Gfo/Idh/MocA family oxidoreductase [Paludicola sp. MB14-C6]|uniref:Gfo/Idh/MocA family protein n=1 Tax=Paludihabitans sp. MB14-C6 TaxID=3070656 RepID=UPI0027DBC76A|nr:Gfo/Idh/MocA family oxidoreductase [Paludicola sp. MB14-C6]WMJ23267.1 Gfo/Idh/MocA family oxidoreductase [Paludicola sp. MB14-C6]